MISQFIRERARSRVVANLALIGAPAEPGSDRFVEQAATAFAAPIALLTVLDDDQVRVKASKGIAIECAPREESFCALAIDRRMDVFEICDATLDPRVNRLPAVTGDMHVRYYIGSPLWMRGVKVGMLCVVDTKPLPPASADQRAYLVGLSRQAAAFLERSAELSGSRAA